jgi:hypothetical protein
MKFTLISEGGGAKVVLEFQSEYLPDILSQVQNFLVASGFVFNQDDYITVYNDCIPERDQIVVPYKEDV